MFALIALLIAAVAAATFVRTRRNASPEPRLGPSQAAVAGGLWAAGAACLTGAFVTGFGWGMTLFVPAVTLLYVAARVTVSRVIAPAAAASGLAAGALCGISPGLSALWLMVGIALPIAVLGGFGRLHRGTKRLT